MQLPYTIHPLVHVLTAVLFAWCAARLFLEWQEVVLHHVLLGSWWKYVSTTARACRTTQCTCKRVRKAPGAAHSAVPYTA